MPRKRRKVVGLCTWEITANIQRSQSYRWGWCGVLGGGEGILGGERHLFTKVQRHERGSCFRKM